DDAFELSLLQLVEQAPRRRDVRRARVAARGEGVGRAVFDHPHLRHRQARANAEVLDDPIQDRLLLLRHLMRPRTREYYRTAPAIHHDRDDERNGARDRARNKRNRQLFAERSGAAESYHGTDCGEEEGEKDYEAAHDHQRPALVLVDPVVDQEALRVPDVYRFGLPIAV